MVLCNSSYNVCQAVPHGVLIHSIKGNMPSVVPCISLSSSAVDVIGVWVSDTVQSYDLLHNFSALFLSSNLYTHTHYYGRMFWLLCSTFVSIPSILSLLLPAGGSVGGVVMPMGSKVVLESPGSSEQNEEEESPDLDVDYLEDYDSDEEKRSHRKKKRVSPYPHLIVRTPHIPLCSVEGLLEPIGHHSTVVPAVKCPALQTSVAHCTCYSPCADVLEHCVYQCALTGLGEA